MADVKVRPATAADAEVALEVLRRSITLSCVADHQNDPQTLSHWLRNKTPERFEQWLSDPSSALFVAELAKCVRGVGKLSRTGRIELCYVDPAFQRCRLGSALLNAMEDQARAWQLSELSLSSSLDACAFYARHGYRSAGPPVEALGAVRGFPFRKRLRPR